jgi:hypothetical protein
MHRTYELYFAWAGVALVTAIYVPVAAQEIPRASSVFGHVIGIIGFLLMLSTETLYSIRKRARRGVGRMSTWLQIHIVTGIVGSYLVLLHSAWKFNGLAGVLMLMTVVVVASGFVGRYIYTAVPRTADGVEVAINELEAHIAAADAQLQAWSASRPAAAAAISHQLAALPDVPQSSVMLVLGRALMQRGYQRRLRRELAGLDAEGRAQAAQLQKLLGDRYRLQRQIRSLAMARRLLSIWHTIHIPLGVALFTIAFIHIGAALYYATFIH